MHITLSHIQNMMSMTFFMIREISFVDIINFNIYSTNNNRYTGSTNTSSQYSNFSTSAKLKDPTSTSSNTSHYERYVCFRPAWWCIREYPISFS